jgi:hypothetical protein
VIPTDLDAIRARVGSALTELERSTESVNVALRTQMHDTIDSAVVDQRRITHEITTLLDADPSLRDGEIGAHIARRLRHIQLVREEQIKYLRGYHSAIGAQLRTIAKYKSTPMARKLESRSLLFEDVR